MSSKLQYFADVPDKSVLLDIPHYRYEIRILNNLQSQLGYSLDIATSMKEISTNADLYYGRWATSGFKSTIISRLARAPSLIYTSGSEITNTKSHTNNESYSDRPLWHRIAIKANLRLCSKVLVSSDYNKKQVQNICTNDVEILPHYIDTSRYSPGEVNTDLPFSNNNYILTISWLSQSHIEGKCLYKIIDLAANLGGKYKFIILGSDRGGYQSLKKYIKMRDVKNNLKVITDFTEEEKIDLMRGARMYFQPTLHEGFGMANLEAMSIGTPVVTSERGAVPEVVGRNAVFVEPDDLKDMCNKIVDLWSDDNRLKKFSKVGRKRAVSNYSIQTGEESFKKVLREYLSDQKSN